MLRAQAIDYVAMDIKAPLSKYALAAGVPIDGRILQRSIDLLRGGEIEYEFEPPLCLASWMSRTSCTWLR